MSALLLSRRRLVKGLMALGFMPGVSGVSADTADGAEAGAKALFREFRLLDERYWSPELGIWLDRPGNDLRACFEGRLNPPWWSCANAVDTLAACMQMTGTGEWMEPFKALHNRYRTNPDVAPLLVEALKKRGQWTPRDERRWQRGKRPRHLIKKGFRDFTNEYLDDSGWWGLAWLRMHQLSGDAAFLETAVAIQGHMNAHRVPEGGIMWNLEQDPPVTNAISNGLFLTLSARLHRITGKAEFLDQARKSREWFVTNHLYDGIGIVDGPGHVGDHWSYNQGMWILGLLALADAEGNLSHLEEAVAFTRGLLEKGGFLKGKVLIEKLSHTGWDTALFKGVLVRALGELHHQLRQRALHADLQGELAAILQASADSVLKHSRGPDGEFGLQWQEGAENQEWNYNSHLSGIMALTAAYSALPPAAAGGSN